LEPLDLLLRVAKGLECDVVVRFMVPPSQADAEARRLARAQAEVRIFRSGDAEADADALYWDRIPVEQRAEFVWRLSTELYGISNPETRIESGLSRSVARIVRR
jgi:hypothetical protein